MRRVGLVCLSPLGYCDSPRMGHNNLAQGRAQRRPGCDIRQRTVALKGPHEQVIVDANTLYGPFRAMIGRFAVPRAALRDVPSQRSALG